jgi:hypothetical protein
VVLVVGGGCVRIKTTLAVALGRVRARRWIVQKILARLCFTFTQARVAALLSRGAVTLGPVQRPKRAVSFSSPRGLASFCGDEGFVLLRRRSREFLGV